MSPNSPSNIAALIILGLMFFLMFFSSVGDSATMDELAHIPAGYSYLALKDYRLNPEHPPLIKDLSAIPLQFLNLKFPTDSPAWKDYINGQWDVGRIFLYESGNNADQIVFWARLPMMLLTVFFGWFFFNSIRGLYGNKVGLLALFLFATSPTFIAHGRYVTTDVGAAFGFFFAIVMFYKFLENNTAKNLLFAGLSLGIALLLKFSLFLLIPLFIVFGLLWIFLQHLEHIRAFDSTETKILHLAKEEGKMILKLAFVFLTALFLITAVYQYHIWNYPKARQKADTASILASFPSRPLADFNIAISDKPIIRGFGHYLLGLLMVSQRAGSGNTIYYWGETAASGWKSYFPMAYLLKEQLAFHILTFITLLGLFLGFLRGWYRMRFSDFTEWLKENFILTMSIIFILVYWLASILSPLNLGIRHILPTLPFIYLLVSRSFVLSLQNYAYPDQQNYREWLVSLYGRFMKSIPKYLFLTAVLLWLLTEIVVSFPYYLSYYNIIGGGTERGWRFIVDSNYDWGQDLKRLKTFVEKNNIEKIAIDYFGGGNPQYYLGDRFEPWWSSKGKPSGWFAISASFRQNAWGKPVKGFERKPEDSYEWLKEYQPVARAGKSIFIYYIE